MKNMQLKKYAMGLTGLGLCLGMPSQAAITESFTFTPGVTIPDGTGPLGLTIVEPITVATAGFTSIDLVTVDLNISGDPAGGFNGDLFVSLTSDLGGIAVLMNRVGLDATPPLGYFGGGVDVSFEDGATNGDIHRYEDITGAFTPDPMTQLTGIWEPDGRITNPPADGDSRSAMLSSFIGIDPNTNWTLLVSDFSFGTPMILESFTLHFTSLTAGGVPEPGTAGMLLAILVALPFLRRYRLKQLEADQ